jgi:hypothetical protein
MWWDAWWHKRRWERRMDVEFQFHLENLIGEFMRAGLSRQEAELRARRQFGSFDLAKDECRDQRRSEWLNYFFRDVGYAWRTLRKNLGFAAAAVLTLALGIGANTAIFSAAYAVLLKPLPYSRPNQIYSVEVVVPERRSQFDSLPSTVQVYLAVSDRTAR